MPTSSGTWLSPADTTVVSGVITISYSFSDVIGNTSNHQLFVRGGLISNTPKLVSGTWRVGTATVVLDTKRCANGSAALLVSWDGSDDVSVNLTVDVTMTNTKYTGVMYRDFKLTNTLDETREYYKVIPEVRLGPVDTSQLKRYYGQASIYKGTPPAFTQVAFDAMQTVILNDYKRWASVGSLDDGVVLGTDASVVIGVPGQDVFLRIREEPALTMTAFETGCEKIIKIREISTGNYLVFGTNPDKVFTYDGTTLTLIVDFNDSFGISGIVDVCLLNDKLYFVYDDRLHAFDTNSEAPIGKRIIDITPFNEPRNVVRVETVETSVIILTSSTSGQTDGYDLMLAYQLTIDQCAPIWDIPIPVGDMVPDPHTYVYNNILYVAGGSVFTAYFYTSSHGTETPVLVGDFGPFAHIDAIGPGAVHLDTNEFLLYIDNEWVSYGTVALTTIGVWMGLQTQLHYLYGFGADTLVEQDEDGAFTATLQLLPPEESASTVSRVNVIERYLNGTDERLLIGTGASGLFFDVSMSLLSARVGAWLCSEIESVVGTAVSRKVA